MDCKKIIHVDMDAFYAAIEQRDNPKLKGKPVIVGGPPEKRGVVSTCSYEARRYGVHSAMATSRALKLCPDAVFIYPRFTVYERVSHEIMNIFKEYTDLVEPLSLDEAYLDVTENKKGIKYATIIAKEIRSKIFSNTGLTASAGVSYNKFLAKTASEINKPNGMAVITPDKALSFLENLAIGKFYGVGEATKKKMLSLGINNGLDLKKTPLETLLKHFGKMGYFYYNIVRGVDLRNVEPYRERKSYGREITLSEDITDMEIIESILRDISKEIEDILKNNNIKGKTITLKIKYYDFNQITRSITINNFTDSSIVIMENVKSLLRFTEAGIKKIRLLGISMSNLDNNHILEDVQLLLPF
ncbi:MAG TPA: DNA polymerase IV [Spirochaetota bacterium]|nr:DNA polymerase IV [Spirochaetota bacterium]HOK93060.1 DNA polymerase IV [Spirochaetota bacterium]HON16915.1 DNA polymerase IV [Spirochaetota bacterium]HPP95767.1 DNA polymerase IV [Spirochaetota bacterium]HRU66539.1 DNA polymerase IV [Spirochaetota bacterium]